MDIEVVRHALVWCTVINYEVLLFWFLLYILSHTWLQNRAFARATDKESVRRPGVVAEFAPSGGSTVSDAVEAVGGIR